MKYAGMPFGMWVLFSGSFQKQLTATPTRGTWDFTNTRMAAATRDALPSAAAVSRPPEYASTTFLTSDIGTAFVQTNLYIFRFVSDAAILIVCLFGIPQARTYFRVGTKSLSTSLQINLGIFYVVPLVIFILTAIYVVLDAINEVNLIRKGDKAQ